MEVDHFAHEHPLILIERENQTRRKYRDDFVCKGCEQLCTFPLYACTECSFFLHKSCVELLRSIRNPFHPHPLTLAFDVDISFTCHACLKGCKGFRFSCLVCDIQLDVDCALLKPSVEEGSQQLQHFTHLHPPALVMKEDTEVTSRFKCLVCGEHCLGPCYGCDHCGIFLHQPCAEFNYPEEVQHFSHPCPLVLHTQVNFFLCGACDTCMLGIFYNCELCDFYLDVECAVLRKIESTDGTQIKHFSHSHTLSLKEEGGEGEEEEGAEGEGREGEEGEGEGEGGGGGGEEEGKEGYCFACRRKLPEPSYVCSQLCQSEFAIHASCATLTPVIDSLLHPQHPLTVVIRSIDEPRTGNCSSCCEPLLDLGYECGACEFELHDQCAKQVPTIKNEDHRHLLLYCENIGHEVTCNACKEPCKPPLLRCPQCDFNLHLHCSPLPYTIKDECHIHTLTLRESPAVSEVSDEFCCDEFYCDACEEKRDQLLPIYFCTKCSFIGEISCVMSKVRPLLKGEKGDVDLRTPEGKIAGNVISEKVEVEKICKAEAAKAMTGSSRPKMKITVNYGLPIVDHVISFFSAMCQRLETLEAIEGIDPQSLMALFTFTRESKPLKDEEDELKRIFWTNEMKTSSNEAEASLYEEGRFESSLYWDMKYRDFLEELDSSQPKAFMGFWIEREEFGNVGNYWVPESLVPTLESILAKYGDVTVDGTSPRVKTFLVVILCWTIDSMFKTRILDISREQLMNWWKYLKALESVGFKIQFALDHLNRVVNAYVGLQLSEKVNENLSDIDEKISKKLQELEDLKRNLKDLKLRKEYLLSGKKSRLIEECIREAYKLKWMKAKEACS